MKEGDGHEHGHQNGTIVTADLTYKADVLIEDGRIAAIGAGPDRRQGAGRDRLLHHAGRDRSAYASGDALHGHLFRR
jgi:hypothetical protein